MVPKRAPFTVLGVVVFRIYPPRIPIFGYPPPKGVRRTLHRECFQYPGSVRVDLKVDEGGGGGPFSQKEGGPRRHLSEPSTHHHGVLVPLEADRAATSGALAVTCHVERSRHRYTSREVLQGPVDEGQDRGHAPRERMSASGGP